MSIEGGYVYWPIFNRRWSADRKGCTLILERWCHWLLFNDQFTNLHSSYGGRENPLEPNGHLFDKSE